MTVSFPSYKRLPKTRNVGRVLDAKCYAWLAFAALVLTIYSPLVPWQYRPRPWEEATETFKNMPYFPPDQLGPRADWVITSLLFATLSFLAVGALCVDHPSSAALGGGGDRVCLLRLAGSPAGVRTDLFPPAYNLLE